MYTHGIFRGILNNYEIYQIVYQPQLRTKFFKNGKIKVNERPIISRSICFKLIRNEMFQRAIINIGPKYTEDFITNYEDTIMIVAIFQTAKSYYLMKDKGYYYSRDDKRGRFPSLKNKTCKPNDKIKDMSHIKFLQYLMEKTADNEIERQMIYHEIISIDYYQNLFRSTNHHYEMVYGILDAMLHSSFINTSQKERLMRLKDNLMQKQNRPKI